MNRAKAREERTLWAAALTNGPAELIDFILPLWVGIALGASATEVGLLMALEMGVSIVARPLAGMLADVRERKLIAAAGAGLYGLSCVLYAFAGSIGPAFVAAALGGLGGALLWVSVRAMIGERLADDSAVYPRLMGAQETGSWVAFVAGLTLLGIVDFRGVFLGCAAACVVAAGALLLAPSRPAAALEPATGLARRLRPMLLAVVVTMAAEAAIGLLLLLHLQRGFDLEVIEIAWVFLPGAIVMGLLPETLHRFAVRFGRTRVLASASVASAAFALSLAWAPNPYWIAGLWVLSGVAWAAVMPIQQAVVAEASGTRVGRGMGLYEAAVLVGGLIGSLAAGVLYDSGSWTVACVIAAIVILAGAFVVPRAVRAMDVIEFPPPAPPQERRARGTEVPPSGTSVPPDVPAADRGKPLRDLGQHAALFAAAQIALAAFGLSALLGHDHGDGFQAVLHGAGRVWTVIFVIDAIWTAAVVARRA